MLTIRCSSLPGFSHCMRREIASQYSDFLGEKGFSIPSAKKSFGYTLVGTGSHAACYHMLSEKIKKGVCSDKKSWEYGISELEKEIEKSGSVEYDKIVFNKDSAIKHIVRFTKVYLNDVASKMIFPESAKPEDHLELSLKNQIRNFKFSGHIDVYTGKSICDTKFSAKIKPYHSQLGGYGLLLGKENFDNLVVNNIPRVGLDKPYPGTTHTVYDKTFCLGEAWSIINRVIDCVGNFEVKRLPSCFPANPNSYLCSRKYCKAFGTDFCQYYK